MSFVRLPECPAPGNLILAKFLPNSQTEEILIRSNFLLEKDQNKIYKTVILLASENYLYICDDVVENESPSQYQRIDFDCQFSIDLRPREHMLKSEGTVSIFKSSFTITFEKNNCESINFYGEGVDLGYEWQEFLQRRLSQRNFHKLFIPIRKLKQGAYSSIYLVRRAKDNKCFVAKAFSKEGTYVKPLGKVINKIIQEALFNEINISRKLNKSSTAHLVGVFESNSSVYLIYDLIEGDHLLNRMQSHIFTNSQTKELMKSLLEGLAYLDGLGIVHRDIKPENLMMKTARSSQVVIIDFGLATTGDQLFNRCGTAGFMAPQIINCSQKCSPLSDMFSAGVVFHCLLLGRSVFSANSYSQLLRQNKACQFLFEGEDYKALSQPTLDLLRRMLEIDPARRISASEALNHEYFRSCEEFETNCASACKEMLTSSTLNSLIDAKTPPAEESKKRTNKHDLSEEQHKCRHPAKKLKKELITPTQIKVSRFAQFEHQFLQTLSSN